MSGRSPYSAIRTPRPGSTTRAHVSAGGFLQILCGAQELARRLTRQHDQALQRGQVRQVFAVRHDRERTDPNDLRGFGLAVGLNDRMFVAFERRPCAVISRCISNHSRSSSVIEGSVFALASVRRNSSRSGYCALMIDCSITLAVSPATWRVTPNNSPRLPSRSFSSAVTSLISFSLLSNSFDSALLRASAAA